MDKVRVLFVCTHNSARSQMAEGFLREYGGDRFEVHSAGTEAATVRPEAIRAMAEAGIDISGHRSKTVERFLGEPFDWVITVCDQAREACPTFPGAEQTAHWGFDDPTGAQGDGEARMAVFRRVRDEIARSVRMFALAARRNDLPQP
ncbi:MAG TPA: arsenate reductase ArsC [Candidatus Limnocylindria bacterium]|jgi:arsenate reductase